VIPSELRYSKDHEWIRLEADGSVTFGITDHAQSQLGDLVFIELPELGDEVEMGGALGVVESVKSVSDLFSPLSGEVIALNEELENAPELLNQSPYNEGWILCIKPSQPEEIDELMDAAAYAALLEAEN